MIVLNPEHLLSWIVFLPVVGMVLCLMAPNAKTVKLIGIITTGLVLLLSLRLFPPFPCSS